MISRRDFLLALVASAVTAPLVATAQHPAKVRTIGFLSPYTSLFLKTRLEAFKQGLADFGYVVGKNIVIEERHTDGRPDRLGPLAAELTRLPLDVLVTHGSNAATYAKQASGSIPIVFIAHADPVGLRTVSSLGRPGGNVTGLSDLHGDLAAKRLELLKEMLPSISRTAVLWNPDNPSHTPQLKEIQVAATALGMAIIPIVLRAPEELERVFATVKAERVNALTILGGAAGLYHEQIAALAIRHRVPTIVTTKESAEAGYLMSYGTSHPDLYRRAATYVDKILKGAKPADLPVEQPTKFELIVNLRTAKQIGVTIPGSVLTRADEVIK